jgi:hypothetical protein
MGREPRAGRAAMAGDPEGSRPRGAGAHPRIPGEAPASSLSTMGATIESGMTVTVRDWPGTKGEEFTVLGPDRPSPRYGPTVRLLDSNRQLRTVPLDRVRPAKRRARRAGAA